MKPGTFAVAMKLTNTSKDAIQGPIFVRVLSAAAGRGRVIVRAEGTTTPLSSIWQFPALVPGETTASRDVTLELVDREPFAMLRLTSLAP